MTENISSDFDAAKQITELLVKIPQPRQERILRWVNEGLGLSAAPKHAAQHQPEEQQAPLLNNQNNGEGVTDIRTFVRSKNPTSDNQLATVIAYFYRFVAPDDERRETLNAEILTDSIRKIGNFNQLKRPNLTLTNAKNQGYLDSAGTGEYKVNSVGENLVTMTLGAGGSGEANVSRKRPAKKKIALKKKPTKAPRKNKKE